MKFAVVQTMKGDSICGRILVRVTGMRSDREDAMGWKELIRLDDLKHVC